jgi:hypothetical protein
LVYFFDAHIFQVNLCDSGSIDDINRINDLSHNEVSQNDGSRNDIDHHGRDLAELHLLDRVRRRIS